MLTLTPRQHDYLAGRGIPTAPVPDRFKYAGPLLKVAVAALLIAPGTTATTIGVWLSGVACVALLVWKVVERLGLSVLIADYRDAAERHRHLLSRLAQLPVDTPTVTMALAKSEGRLHTTRNLLERSLFGPHWLNGFADRPVARRVEAGVSLLWLVGLVVADAYALVLLGLAAEAVAATGRRFVRGVQAEYVGLIGAKAGQMLDPSGRPVANVTYCVAG